MNALANVCLAAKKMSVIDTLFVFNLFDISVSDTHRSSSDYMSNPLSLIRYTWSRDRNDMLCLVIRPIINSELDDFQVTERNQNYFS